MSFRLRYLRMVNHIRIVVVLVAQQVTLLLPVSASPPPFCPLSAVVVRLPSPSTVPPINGAASPALQSKKISLPILLSRINCSSCSFSFLQFVFLWNLLQYSNQRPSFIFSRDFWGFLLDNHVTSSWIFIPNFEYIFTVAEDRCRPQRRNFHQLPPLKAPARKPPSALLPEPPVAPLPKPPVAPLLRPAQGALAATPVVQQPTLPLPASVSPQPACPLNAAVVRHPSPPTVHPTSGAASTPPRCLAPFPSAQPVHHVPVQRLVVPVWPLLAWLMTVRVGQRPSPTTAVAINGVASLKPPLRPTRKPTSKSR